MVTVYIYSMLTRWACIAYKPGLMTLVKPIIAVSGDLIGQLPAGVSCWNHANKVGLGGWSRDLRHHLVS